MGLSYELWLAKLSQSAFQRSLQAETSLLAVRGNKCGFAFGKVWTLPVSINNEQLLSVRCSIPRGKVLATIVGSSTGFMLERFEKQEQAAIRRYFAASVVDVSLTVDGRSLRPGYLVGTPVYYLRLRQRNALGLPPGLYTALSRGYLALLRLPAGEHVVSTRAEFRNPSDVFGVTYYLSIS
jgi:hypothetical protein